MKKNMAVLGMCIAGLMAAPACASTERRRIRIRARSRTLYYPVMAAAFFVACLLLPVLSVSSQEPPYVAEVSQGSPVLLPESRGPARSHQDDPFLNPSFESGAFTSWVTLDMASPFSGLAVRGPGFTPWGGFFVTTPTDGSFVADHGFDGGGPDTIEISQDVTLPGNALAVTFDYRAAWDFFTAIFDRTFEVVVEPSGGGGALQTTLVFDTSCCVTLVDTGPLSGSVDVSAFAGQSVRIKFRWNIPESFTGPAHFQLDNVQLTRSPPSGYNWLVIGSSSPANVNTAAVALGAAVFTTTDFAAESLAGMDVLIFSELSVGSFVINAATKTKVSDFVAAGGGLYIEDGGGWPALDYSWVPHDGVTSGAAVGIELVSMQLTGHPMSLGLTDAGLDNWSQSAHGEFTATAGLSEVFTNTSTGLPVTLAGYFGRGKVVYSNLDPTFSHSGGGAPEQTVLTNGLRFVSQNWLVVGPSTTNIGHVAQTLGAVVSTTTNLASTPLEGIDVLIFDENSPSSFTINAATKNKVSQFAMRGGGPYVELGGDFSANDYSWVPHNTITSNNTVSTNSVSISLGGHPIAASVTDAGLDNWNLSAHGDFTSTAGLDEVFTNTGTGLPVTLAGSFGLGQVVYSSLDPTFSHSGGGTTEPLVLENSLGWVPGDRTAGLLAASTGDGLDRYGALDRSSGLFRELGSSSLFVHAMAYDRNTSTLYGTVNASSSAGTPTELAIIDQTTGALTIIGANGVSIEGLAFDPNTSTLYGSDQDTAQLYSINTSTGAVATIGAGTLAPSVGGLAYDRFTDTLYGINDASPSELVTIDTATGVMATVGTGLGLGINDVDNLAFSEADGMLYGIDCLADELLVIDPATGLAVSVGSTGTLWGLVNGMASRAKPPSYYTEQFTSADNDLDNTRITYVPTGSPSFYTAYREVSSGWSVDPAGGTVLFLFDDDFLPVALSGGRQVALYGTRYSSFFVGSNGYITFNSGDTDYIESLAGHFGPEPRISALFNDFDPSAGGSVSVMELPDRAVVTFDSVPEWGIGGSNSFQIEQFYDGVVRITYRAVSAMDGLAGLSDGSGLPFNFDENDLSTETIFTIADSDLDGIPDFYEHLHGLDPTSNDAAGDADGDGLSNGAENSLGTSASVFDTDGDGIGDGEEVGLGISPTDPTNPGPETWVDFSYVGTESGTFVQPYNTLGEGLGAVPPAGRLLVMAGSQNVFALIINQSVTIKAVTGTVTLF